MKKTLIYTVTAIASLPVPSPRLPREATDHGATATAVVPTARTEQLQPSLPATAPVRRDRGQETNAP